MGQRGGQRRWRWVVALLALTTANVGEADIRIEGERLHVATNRMEATFFGPELAELRNIAADERPMYGVRPRTPLTRLQAGDGSWPALRITEWRTGKNPNAAMLTLKDLARTAVLSVSVDSDTDEIVVEMWADAREEGLRGLQFGIRNLDATAGRLLLPTAGDQEIRPKALRQARTLPYPAEWQAPFFVWQGAKGGIVAYSPDGGERRTLTVTPQDSKADLQLTTEAPAPWAKCDHMPAITWRIDCYKGDWRGPAQRYRDLMYDRHPPVPTRGGRGWVTQIDRVVEVPIAKAADWQPPADAEPASATLVRFVGALPYSGAPDATLAAARRAKQAGCRVMLDLDVTAPGDAERWRRQLVLRPDADTALEPTAVSLASLEWRAHLAAAAEGAMAEAPVDALMLIRLDAMPNDGRPERGGNQAFRAAGALCRALLTRFPNLILASSTVCDALSPFVWWARDFPEPSAQPGVSQFLFGAHLIRSSATP
ncbi:MAG: hypothetical protein NT029_19255 [Armatimonadetes bacterium]|nr:hypothetical protein [Armatimonadota bacterium]